MPYSNFKKITDVASKFGLTLRGGSLFKEEKILIPSDYLKSSLEIARKTGFSNEKERSERLVFPVLADIAMRNDNTITVYSGRNLDVDIENDLSGECDFLLSLDKTIIEELLRPIFSILEAKEQDLRYGLAQCSAQVVGAKKYNEAENIFLPVYYGCATTGVEWRFFKLENNQLTLDDDRYLISDTGKLLGAIQSIVEDCKK